MSTTGSLKKIFATNHAKNSRTRIKVGVHYIIQFQWHSNAKTVFFLKIVFYIRRQVTYHIVSSNNAHFAHVRNNEINDFDRLARLCVYIRPRIRRHIY